MGREVLRNQRRTEALLNSVRPRQPLTRLAARRCCISAKMNNYRNRYANPLPYSEVGNTTSSTR